MWLLQHVDFYGSDKELEELDQSFKDMAEATDGMEYKGRYSPQNKKWHWTYFFKVKDYHVAEESQNNWKYDRDKSKFTHGIGEFYR